jgi:hypothetical protein
MTPERTKNGQVRGGPWDPIAGRASASGSLSTLTVLAGPEQISKCLQVGRKTFKVADPLTEFWDLDVEYTPEFDRSCTQYCVAPLDFDDRTDLIDR